MTDLGQRVEAARLERGWSKEQAAREAGISSITWKRVEDGKNVHDHKRAQVLAAVGLGPEYAPNPARVEAMRDTIAASDLPEATKLRLLAALDDPRGEDLA